MAAGLSHSGTTEQPDAGAAGQGGAHTPADRGSTPRPATTLPDIDDDTVGLIVLLRRDAELSLGEIADITRLTTDQVREVLELHSGEPTHPRGMPV